MWCDVLIFVPSAPFAGHWDRQWAGSKVVCNQSSSQKIYAAQLIFLIPLYCYITNPAQTNFIWMVPDLEVGTGITNKRIEFKYIYIVILPNREIILPWREDPNGQTCVRWIWPHASCWTDRQWQLAQSRLGRLCCASGFVLIKLTGNRIELLGRVPRSQLEYVSRAGPHSTYRYNQKLSR